MAEQSAQVKVAFSKSFLVGFVEECYARNMDASETEDAFRKFACNHLIAQPKVYAGFRETINAVDVPLSKAAMAIYLQPDIIAEAAETHIKFASTPMAEALRASLDLPDPSWDNVEPGIRKIAGQLSGLMHQFNALPLQQQVLLSSLAGAGVGALKRTALPTGDDEMNQRGMLNRGLRGALRGGAVGAGAGLGAGLGGRYGGKPGSQGRMIGNGVGGLAGAAGAYELSKMI